MHGSWSCMAAFPRDPRLDSTLALLQQPYDYISTCSRALGSDVFEARFMMRKTICMTGKEAAQLFYDPERFQRKHAAPLRLQQSLLGTRGVQTTDDQVHAHRKRMFLELMTPARLAVLSSTFADELIAAATRWTSTERVVLYDALHEVLARTVCRWAGVPLGESEIGERTRELTLMFDRAGAVGPPHWMARHARNKAERWIARLIEAIRSGKQHPPEETAACQIAFHRDLDGNYLSPRTAAIELLNILRPTVALSVYIIFIAHALHLHQECKAKLDSESEYARWFVQEVRRFYPFFPAVPALVRQEFEWHGYRFPAHRRVMLDLHGVNHDPGIWDKPERFEPERFRYWTGDPFSFIPQGGGEHARGHRCAGEALTIELMITALRLLIQRLAYAVPPQDLAIDSSRLPALPRSKFVIENVRVLS